MNRRDFLGTSFGFAFTAGLRGSKAHAVMGERPTVRTTAGLVQGTMQDEVACFKGIPYGADTRTTRFQAPRPAPAWKGIRDASAWADRAPQLGNSGSRAQQPAQDHTAETYHLPPDEGSVSEDCLHLNVWTPSPHQPGHKQRPVLVYIHGGAYNGGTVNSTLYDGSHLARRGNAVVVTVNHRLNAFGFLYLSGVTNDPAYADSGNAGMLDLVLALRWVQENIAAFGGDPTRVLIFGQSGGGAKCATLMAMPPAQGLFQRVMTMSGQQVTAAPRDLATARTQQFLAKLNLENITGQELRKALDAMPLDRLEEAARVSSAWLPVVDGRSLPRDPFSPDAPPLSSAIPMILGNTHDETRGLIGSTQPALFSLTWQDLPAALQKNVGAYLGPVSPEEVVSRYRAWYPAYSASDVFFAAATAFRSWPGQVMEAERRAESPAQSRTWVYQMNWRSPIAGGRYGAPHTVDIAFFFDNLAASPGVVGSLPDAVKQAQPLADAMSETLLAFARTGNPNHSGLPHWPAYDMRRRATMVWDLPPHVEDDPRGQERTLAAAAHYRQPGT